MNQKGFDKYQTLIDQLLNCPDLKPTTEILNRLSSLNNLKTTEEILNEYSFLIDRGLILAIEQKTAKLIKEEKIEAAEWLQNLAINLDKKINCGQKISKNISRFKPHDKLAKALENEHKLSDSNTKKNASSFVDNIYSLDWLSINRNEDKNAKLLTSEVFPLKQALFLDHDFICASNLAIKADLLIKQEKYAEAKSLNTEALKIYQRSFFEDHSNIADCLGIQVWLLMNQREYDEAERLAKEELAMRKRLFLSDHPTIAISLFRLTHLLMEQGRYKEAESSCHQALEIYQRLFQNDHPYIATSFHTLADLLMRQGRYEEAESSCRQALTIREKFYEGDHPALVDSLNGLGYLLMGQGRYEKAESFFGRALEMGEKLFLGDHLVLATILCNFGQLLINQGNYHKAEPKVREALRMYHQLFSSDHPAIADTSNILAQLLIKKGQYSEAKKVIRKVLIIYKRVFSSEHPAIIQTLHQLVQLYKEQGEFCKAESLIRYVLLREYRLFTDNHPNIASSLTTLALLLMKRGEYDEAESCCYTALNIRKKIFKGDNFMVAASFDTLAELLIYQGQNKKAEFLYRDALEMRKRLFKGDHLYIAAGLINVAKSLRQQGKYTKAVSLSQKAVEMYQRLLSDDSSDLAISFDTLGLSLEGQGNYLKAEFFYQKALTIRQKIFKEDHPSIAASYSSLASLFIFQGKLHEAEYYCRKALLIRKNIFSKDNPELANNLSALSQILTKQGKYTEAESLIRNALVINQKLFKEDNPATIYNLGILFQSLMVQKKYREAEDVGEKVLEIGQRLFKGNHPFVAAILDNLGWLFIKQRKWKEAEIYSRDAWAMIQVLFEEEHPFAITDLQQLIISLINQDRYSEATTTFRQKFVIENKLTSRIFGFSSESDRLYHLFQIQETTESFLSFIYNYLQHDIETIYNAFDLVLQRKSLSAAAAAAFNAVIYEERYVHLKEKFQKLRSLSEQIRHIEFDTQPREETKKRLEQLKNKSKLLEQHLASQVPEIQLQTQEINRQMVAERLPEGSILIELICFSNYNFQNLQYNSEYYLAFILPAKQPDKVTMKVLGEATEIDRLIDTTRRQAISHTNVNDGKSIPFYHEKLDDDSPFDEDETPTEQLNSLENCYLPTSAIQLRKVIFDPLREYLEDSQQLFIIPDGKLSLIPFQLLPLDEQGEELLIDRYRFSYLSAARDLFRSDVETQRPASPPLVLADPKFYLNSFTAKSVNSNSETLKSTSTRGIEVLNLQGEKDKTKKLFLKRLKAMGLLGTRVASILNVEPHLQEDALVTYLKNNQCPSILFIGTHGLYFPQKREPLTEPTSLNPNSRNQLISQAENPMLRSALTFTGAGTWLDSGNLPPEAGTGFLFAQEVAELDLWANEITVLLACNSGVGDISIGEGVFGLRRAFAVAGVKTLIMSLWSVPVKASALLMERFFNNLQQSGMKRDKALQEAQNYIRNLTIFELLQSELGLEVLEELAEGKNLKVEFIRHWDENQKNQKPLSHPFYWAAWICQGETTPLPSTLKEISS